MNNLIPSTEPDTRFPSVLASDCKEVLRTICANRYFTNHGPLAQEFESALQSYLGIGHLIAVGNGSLALLIALTALEIRGKVIVPAYRAETALRAAEWLKIPVSVCDVDLESHQVSLGSLASNLSGADAAILVETWGNRCDERIVNFLVSQDVKVIILAFDSFSSKANERYVLDAPNVVTVFSFGPEQILSTMQGGGIALSDARLANKCRNIRSSYGAGQTQPVTATCNGRFSEFQAGFGLISLAQVEQRIGHYRLLGNAYRGVLGNVRGIQLYDFPTTQRSNGAHFPIRVKDVLTRNKLCSEIALGYDVPPECRHMRNGRHGRSDVPRNKKRNEKTYPNADRLASEVLQLPVHYQLCAHAAAELADTILRNL